MVLTRHFDFVSNRNVDTGDVDTRGYAVSGTIRRLIDMTIEFSKPRGP
jgi:hypothetical protein